MLVLLIIAASGCSKPTADLRKRLATDERGSLYELKADGGREILLSAVRPEDGQPSAYTRFIGDIVFSDDGLLTVLVVIGNRSSCVVPVWLMEGGLFFGAAIYAPVTRVAISPDNSLLLIYSEKDLYNGPESRLNWWNRGAMLVSIKELPIFKRFDDALLADTENPVWWTLGKSRALCEHDFKFVNALSWTADSVTIAVEARKDSREPYVPAEVTVPLTNIQTIWHLSGE